ncbi:MAG: glycosyltransferase family 4 protein [Eubacterium sp.]|nr:glycosyltransferase family 4 protein [Eubacterium sp.]
MKNVIMVDFRLPKSWAFHKELEKVTGKKWELLELVCNANHKGAVQNAIRYFKYFYLPLKILFKKNRYEYVIAWQQFFGIALAFYFRIFHIKKTPDLTVMTFIYKPKKSLFGKLYDRFMRFSLHSGCINRIIVYSKSEAKHYSKMFCLPEEMFHYISLGIDDLARIYPPETDDEKYFISTGRSNRDYDFLEDCWQEDYPALHIICDYINKPNAENIVYMNNCFGLNFLNELRRCFAVIIPLSNEEISSGQLVVLQAMMYGKPVIATKNNTLFDYIDNNNDGFIIEKSSKALSETLEKLNNPEVYSSISKNARKSFENKFSLKSMGSSVGNIILEYEKTEGIIQNEKA